MSVCMHKDIDSRAITTYLCTLNIDASVLPHIRPFQYLFFGWSKNWLLASVASSLDFTSFFFFFSYCLLLDTIHSSISHSLHLHSIPQKEIDIYIFGFNESHGQTNDGRAKLGFLNATMRKKLNKYIRRAYFYPEELQGIQTSSC